MLDGILEQYVEHDRSVQEIVAMGYDYATVARVAQMVDRNEYKRRQAPPGVKITPKAFGRDRRLPMASRYRPCVIQTPREFNAADHRWSADGHR